MSNIPTVITSNQAQKFFFLLLIAYTRNVGIGNHRYIQNIILNFLRYLAGLSAAVMDRHATARGSIPVGNGVFTELHVLRKGQ